MNKQEIITNDIKVPNKDMEVLRKHFSHCFDKNGDFQIEKFKQSISENEISFSKESYSMDWLGKSYARLLASDPATTLLKEDKEHNQKPENKEAENLLLKGDNLEVLKHLTSAYYEKIKMIYIDPPYNTGGDGFVYQDDRKFTVEELQDLAGIDKERAQRILDFTQSKSNSHSAWLTFMYPRLYIAKQLLREDGVIFISIDDNEVAQLKLMMDEIFGEENFLGIISNSNNPKGRSDDRFIATAHEYIITYSKFINKTIWHGFKPDNKIIKRYNKVDENNRKYREIDLRKTGENDLRLDRPNLFYYFYYNEKTKDFYPSDKKRDIENYIRIIPLRSDNLEGNWRWSIETAKNKIDKIFPKFMPTREVWGVMEKDFLDERGLVKPTSSWTFKDVNSERGSEALRNLSFDKRLFSNPKPIGTIQRCCKLGINKNEIILDFFAGSGTTGDAVMQLNAEDGGNRKYILVQLPEVIDKKDRAAYEFVTKELKAEPTIFEITKERLLRAAKKINQELDEKNKDLEARVKTLKTELPTEETKEEIDLLKEEIQVNKQVQKQNNFKVFETMPIWEDYHFEAKELDEQLELFDESKLTEEDLQALLITWKTYDGIPLTQDLKKMNLSGYQAYYANDKLYMMDKDFAIENLQALLELIDTDKDFNPTSVIVFGYHFESKNLRALAENLKSYSNKKHIDIDFITRY